MDTDLVRALVGVLEAKDISTAAHTWRVVLYARALAERLGADREYLMRLTLAAALHDVGKVYVPDAVLLKPRPLDASERAMMERHTTMGWEHLRLMGESDPLVLDLVRHHHERIDGLGYPDRLCGDAVPIAARYFSVVDSFDAMTSIRPYRSDVGEGAARRALVELRSAVGTRYCAEAVEAFAAVYEAGGIGWILDYYNDRCQVPPYEMLRDVERLEQ